MPHREPCCQLSDANHNSQERGRDGRAAICALVLSLCEVIELMVEFLHLSIVLRRFECVHRGTVEASKCVDQISWRALRRERKRIFGHSDMAFGHSRLAKALNNVWRNSPRHRTNEAFWRRRQE